MSFGTFSTYIQPKQVYGLTTAARLSGMMMDIDRLYGTAVDKDNKRENVVAFIASQGPRQSANEHLIPEALFDNPNSTEKEAEAISAVKALQIATQQGQKIFTINQTNLSTVLPQLSHKATVMQDVKDAVAAGKIVTISQRTVSYQGWTGTGYVITDPNTGARAYLIGGGMDGALCLALGIIGLTIALSGIFLAVGSGGGIIFILSNLSAIMSAISSSFLLIIKGLAILDGKGDVRNVCRTYASGLFFSAIAFGAGAMATPSFGLSEKASSAVGLFIGTLGTIFSNFTTVTSALVNRICG